MLPMLSTFYHFSNLCSVSPFLPFHGFKYIFNDIYVLAEQSPNLNITETGEFLAEITIDMVKKDGFFGHLTFEWFFGLWKPWVLESDVSHTDSGQSHALKGNIRWL